MCATQRFGLLFGMLAVVIAIGVPRPEANGKESSGESKAVAVSPSDLVNDRFRQVRDDPTNNAQCGVNCLYMLLKAQHPESAITLLDIRKMVPVTERGSTLGQLQAGAKAFGHDVRVVRCSATNLDELPLPAVALIEPNSLDNYVTHFVVIVKVTDKLVSYVDPTLGDIHYERADFARWTTGYYLISNESRWTTRRVLVFLLGCVLVGVAITNRRVVARMMNWVRTNRKMAPAAVLVMLALTGCSKSGSKTQSFGPPRSLEFDGPLHRHLGLIAPSTDTKTKFSFRSTRESNIELSVGQPSCGCLQVVLTPGKEIKVGGEGFLKMSLRTTEFSAGPVEGTVAVGIENENETYQLSLAAFVEGIVGGQYVVRPHMIRKGQFPDLVLVAFTEGKDVELSVISVTPRDPFSKQPYNDIEIRVSDLTIGSPKSYPDSGCQREIHIPIHVRNISAPIEGEFGIKYRLRNTERESVVPFFVIPPES